MIGNATAGCSWSACAERPVWYDTQDLHSRKSPMWMSGRCGNLPSSNCSEDSYNKDLGHQLRCVVLRACPVFSHGNRRQPREAVTRLPRSTLDACEFGSSKKRNTDDGATCAGRIPRVAALHLKFGGAQHPTAVVWAIQWLIARIEIKFQAATYMPRSDDLACSHDPTFFGAMICFHNVRL